MRIRVRFQSAADNERFAAAFNAAPEYGGGVDLVSGTESEFSGDFAEMVTEFINSSAEPWAHSARIVEI